MVSRRYYFSIITLMAVIFVLFIFSAVAVDRFGDFNVNPGSQAPRVSGEKSFDPLVSPREAVDSANYAVYIGQRDSLTASTVREYCTYAKKYLIEYDGLDKYKITGDTENLPAFIVISPEDFDAGETAEKLEELSARQVNIVLANLPETEAIRKDEKLRNLLGIKSIRSDEARTEGIRFLKGFLLGGELEYYLPRPEKGDRRGQRELQKADLNFNIPWYVTGSGTKSFAVGIMEEHLAGYSEKNELFPAIAWRNNAGEAYIYCINGDYMESAAGLGFLRAFEYEMGDYLLYPVVNARNVILTDFVDYSGGDEQKIGEMYSRSLTSVQKDIIWPGLGSRSTINKDRITAFATVGYNTTDNKADKSDHSFYLQQLSGIGSEAGVSLNYGEGLTESDRISGDNAFYKSLGSRYIFTALSVPKDGYGLTEIRALADEIARSALSDAEGDYDYLKGIRSISAFKMPGEPVLSYTGYDKSITLQSQLMETLDYTYSQDISVRAALSAIGYYSVGTDMHRVAWPVGDEDSWQNVSNEMSGPLMSLAEDYKVFDGTTLSQSDERTRNFLNMDYRTYRDGADIGLAVTGSTGESYFILRTHGDEIEDMTGGDYRLIEDNAYLIRLKGREGSIKLKNRRLGPEF